MGYTMQTVDCLIIGAGPAGLTAALYLARFRRDVVVADSGLSRAALIPVSHNFPGFPEGVSGVDLLKRLRTQAGNCGANIVQGQITEIDISEGMFKSVLNGQPLLAKTLLLATGISDEHPAMENWTESIQAGKIRLCPICDGFDVKDKNIGIISSLDCSATHALFLRTYSSRITLFCQPSAENLSHEVKEKLKAAGVVVSEETVTAVDTNGERPSIRALSSAEYQFDTLYILLGEARGTHFAKALGASCNSAGNLILDEHQRTSVQGLYAAGDVANSLHQISVAVAQAAIAATHIHNNLPPNYRDSAI
jgi:thioredoxin reductase (NADPH)